MKLVAFIILLLSVSAQPDFDNFYVTRKQLLFQQHELTAAELIEYGALSDVAHLQSTAERLAVPRVVGTQNHREVREFIVNNLKDLNWSVEVQTFEAETPIFGKLQFHNVIAKLNPNAEHYLMLACHYDSKYFADIEFVGATDSAVPCAMLLNLAHVLEQPLQNLRHHKLSLMLVFFDGEEAFLQWNDKDSIYGAKHMAKTWHDTGFLNKIDMLVLLDLIGMPDPKFYSFFSNTEIWYARLLDIEDRLNERGYLEKYASSGMVQQNNNRYFQEQHMRSSYIEDDHVPFLRRGVPVIHLISTPFPDVWHTIGDNLTVIDFITTENIARIIRLFAIEYLHGDCN